MPQIKVAVNYIIRQLPACKKVPVRTFENYEW